MNIVVNNNSSIASIMKKHFGYWPSDSIINGFITYGNKKEKDDLGLVSAECSFFTNMGTMRFPVKITENVKDKFNCHVIDGNEIILN